VQYSSVMCYLSILQLSAHTEVVWADLAYYCIYKWFVFFLL